MTKPQPKSLPAAVKEAAKRASIPKRQVIRHTSLFRAELQAALHAANNELLQADAALSSAADDRNTAIDLANQKYEAIRLGIDEERADLHTKIAGIEAALAATAPVQVPDNVVPLKAAGE